MTLSLFPDYSVLETGRNAAQAMRLARQLQEVDLQVLVSDADTRMVVARLRREGIDNAMQLILLTEEEVMQWYNVGTVFLSILSKMRRQVIADPEGIVRKWNNQFRLFVLPDDLRMQTQEDDFFGTMMVSEDEASYSALTSDSGRQAPPDSVLQQEVCELEICLAEGIEMICHRTDFGAVLRSFFIDGLPVESIAAKYHLASNASVFRIVRTRFCEPLQKGYQTAGVQFSNTLLKSVRRLRKELLYLPLSVLDGVERIAVQRFLYFLGLDILRRTQTETCWGGDFIVKEGEVEKCRRTQRELFSLLQWRVVCAKENVIRRGIKRPHVPFLRALLKSHPYVEYDRKGYRLVRERLTYDCGRLARIVYDARRPMTFDELLTTYEHLYLERPQNLSLSNVRTRFPQVHSVARGVWEWK